MLDFIKMMFPGRKLNKWQVRLIEKKYPKDKTDAEMWLGRFRNGEVDAPDVDTIIFNDGTTVSWNGARWELSDA